MAQSVRWWGQEAYGSPPFTMAAGTSRNERSRSLSDYLYAITNLAESGPDEIAVARDFLRDSYYPLSNAAWRYTSGFGFTEVPVGDDAAVRLPPGVHDPLDDRQPAADDGGVHRLCVGAP